MMESQSYGYTAQSSAKEIAYIYRPLINVLIGEEEDERSFMALVDSGTEVTAMDMSIAKVLGITSEGKQKGTLSALGTDTEGFISSVPLKFEKFDETFHFGVLFVEGLSKNFDIILGQQDFFFNFDVTFKKAENGFYLTRHL